MVVEKCINAQSFIHLFLQKERIRILQPTTKKAYSFINWISNTEIAEDGKQDKFWRVLSGSTFQYQSDSAILDWPMAQSDKSYTLHDIRRIYIVSWIRIHLSGILNWISLTFWSTRHALFYNCIMYFDNFMSCIYKIHL